MRIGDRDGPAPLVGLALADEARGAPLWALSAFMVAVTDGSGPKEISSSLPEKSKGRVPQETPSTRNCALSARKTAGWGGVTLATM